jgi:electron transport complex protein RnfB
MRRDTVHERLLGMHEGKGMFPLPRGKNAGFLGWLEHWLTEEEASFLLLLPLEYEPPAPAEDLADRAGMTTETAVAMLETLMDKAMVVHAEVEESGGRGYTQGSWLYITECYLHRYVDVDNPAEVDARMGRWLEDIMQSEQLEEKASYFRVIPIEEAIEDTRGVVSPQRASEIVSKADYIAVMRCLCRSSSHLVGEPCQHPLEVCFAFGDHGRQYVERRFGREVTREWALKTVRECEDQGLIHATDNIQGTESVLCNCCSCHCIALTGFRGDDQVIRSARSNFISVVSSDECVGSGECVEKCPYHALELKKGTAVVEQERCIGCGLCTTVCPTEAISLKVRTPEQLDKFYGSVEEYTEDLTR